MLIYALTDSEITAGVRGAKAAAVREAFANGHDKPTRGVAWIKSTYGLDITPSHFAAASVRIRRELKQDLAPRSDKSSPVDKITLRLDDISTLRRMIADYGASTLKFLIDELTQDV